MFVPACLGKPIGVVIHENDSKEEAFFAPRIAGGAAVEGEADERCRCFKQEGTVNSLLIAS
jgi:hypothetical protein